MYQTSGF